jgi:GWxTD domain-containing protein
MYNIITYILISLSLDYATFRQNDTLSLGELYIAIPYTSLSYTDYKGGKKADFKIDIIIKNRDGDTIARDEFNRVSFLTSFEEAEERALTIIDVFSIPLPKGKYEVALSIEQEDNIERAATQIEVQPYIHGGLSISDIELAYEISKTDTESQFTKGNYNIIPNPERIYGVNRNIVYLYSELYGLHPSKKYSLIYRLTDTMGSVITKYPEKRALATYPYLREIGGINTTGLATGSYVASIQLSQGDDTVYASKPFYVIAREKIPSILDGKEAEYYSFIDYIATTDELARYKKTDDKKSFLQVFWTRRGEEALSSHIKKVKEAERIYGKESDRGRIFIIYGNPDEIKRYIAEAGYPDCEVWWYYGGGGKVFIFSDVSRIGSYRLIYSSYEQEYTDPNYYRYVPPDVLQLLH